jgi:hypothetical protein
MRTLMQTGLVISAAAMCLAGSPGEAFAEHADPTIQIRYARDGGFRLSIGEHRVSHYRQHRHGAVHRRERRLVAMRERLLLAADRALHAGELRRARRLFSRAIEVEERRSGQGSDRRHHRRDRWRRQ